MRVLFAIFLVWGFNTIRVVGQSAGINTTAPHSSAALHVMETNNKGLLIPALSSAPSLHEDGLLFYNTTGDYLQYSNGGSWIPIVPVPSGTIIMWSGLISNIPDGWVLCDGGTYNYNGEAGSTVTTPNLKGRFIAGYSVANTSYHVGAAYGFKSVPVLMAQMPAHSHSISSNHNHGISLTGGEHTHDFSVTDITRHSIGGFVSTTAPYAGVSYSAIVGLKFTNTVSTTVTIHGNGTGISLGYTGSGAERPNRPEYYTLAYIMKL